MTEIRLGWILLGVLLVLTGRPSRLVFVLAWMVPWLLGGLALVGARATRVVAGGGSLANDPLVRIAAVLLAGAVAGTGLAFGAFAALILAAWVGAAVLLALGAGHVAPARTLLVGVALSTSAIVTCLWVAEAGLGLPRFARAFGTPRERVAWEAAYDSTWSRNVFGLRTPTERVARAPGVQRIIALGDSYTWGDKVPSTDSTWPSLLEQRLQAGGRAAEVVNLGQRGFTLANEGEQLRRLGWQFDPDLVVWQFFVNDAYPSWPNFGREGEGWISVLPARFRQGAAGQSALLYLVDRAVNQALRGSDGAAAYGPLYADSAVGWRQLDSALAEGGDSARARGVPMVLVLYPAFVPGEWSAESYPLRAQHAKVADAARAKGIVVLDLAPVFAAEGGNWRRWWALPWDSHPSGAAHVVAADAIAATVAAELTSTGPAAPAASHQR